MKRIFKAFYIVLVAIIVFLGGLLICEGVLHDEKKENAQGTKLLFPFDFFEEGSAV